MKKLESKLVSEKVLNNCNNLEELVTMMSTTVDGKNTGEIDSVNSFIGRYELYKEQLKNNLPEFSLEELSIIFQNYHKIIDTLTCFSEFERFQQCLEFELLKKDSFIESTKKINNEEEEYYKVLKSGMFWEFHPELSGIYIDDKEAWSKFLKSK